MEFWDSSWAYFEKDKKVPLGDRTAICLSVTAKIANSNWDPVTGAETEVQDLRRCQPRGLSLGVMSGG